MASVLVTLNDHEGHSPVAGLFQVQFVEHVCSILPDFNRQRARAVPQPELGFSFTTDLNQDDDLRIYRIDAVITLVIIT